MQTHAAIMPVRLLAATHGEDETVTQQCLVYRVRVSVKREGRARPRRGRGHWLQGHVLVHGGQK